MYQKEARWQECQTGSRTETKRAKDSEPKGGLVLKTNIAVEKELVVKVPDEVGAAMKVTTALAQSGVNIKAICGYSVDGDAHLRIVTNDNEKAKKALSAVGIGADEYDVVRCEVSPNALHPDLGSALSGFEVENNYWCASAFGGEHAVLYFSMKGNIHPSSANI